MAKYLLTQQQQQHLTSFINRKLADYIDEHISGEFLIPDELVNKDDWDAINARKRAALEYIFEHI